MQGTRRGSVISRAGDGSGGGGGPTSWRQSWRRADYWGRMRKLRVEAVWKHPCDSYLPAGARTVLVTCSASRFKAESHR